MIMNCSLQDIYYYSAILGVVLIFLSVIIYLFQLKATNKQLRVTNKQLETVYKQLSMNSLITVFDEMKNLHSLTHKVYDCYRAKPDCSKWTESERINANEVCIALERIAFLTVKGFIELELLMEAYAGVFARSWHCLEGYVKEDRRKRNNPIELKDGARLREHFEVVGIKCQEFYKERGLTYRTETTIKEKYHK